MSNLKLSISKLRFSSIYLFLFSVIALLGSLVVHNYIVEFEYKPSHYSFFKFEKKQFLCSKENEYCYSYKFTKDANELKLDHCGKFITNINILFQSKIFVGSPEYDRIIKEIEQSSSDDKFEVVFNKTNNIWWHSFFRISS